MEKKNTILLTVIAIATLLVAVVGATFAYFTATVTTENNNQNTINGTTALLTSATMDFGNKVTAKNLYPGAKIVKHVNVTGECAADTSRKDCNPIEAIISVNPDPNVGANFTAADGTSDIVWTLYRSENPIVCKNPEKITTGEPSTSGETTTTENQFSMEGNCKIITDSDLKSQIADAVDEDAIATIVNGIDGDTWNGFADVSTLTALTADTISTGNGSLITGDKTADSATISVNGNTDDNYYLVVWYKNNGNQDTQQGKDFTISLGFKPKSVTNAASGS